MPRPRKAPARGTTTRRGMGTPVPGSKPVRTKGPSGRPAVSRRTVSTTSSWQIGKRGIRYTPRTSVSTVTTRSPFGDPGGFGPGSSAVRRDIHPISSIKRRVKAKTAARKVATRGARGATRKRR